MPDEKKEAPPAFKLHPEEWFLKKAASPADAHRTAKTDKSPKGAFGHAHSSSSWAKHAPNVFRVQKRGG